MYQVIESYYIDERTSFMGSVRTACLPSSGRWGRGLTSPSPPPSARGGSEWRAASPGTCAGRAVASKGEPTRLPQTLHYPQAPLSPTEHHTQTNLYKPAEAILHTYVHTDRPTTETLQSRVHVQSNLRIWICSLCNVSGMCTRNTPSSPCAHTVHLYV